MAHGKTLAMTNGNIINLECNEIGGDDKSDVTQMGTKDGIQVTNNRGDIELTTSGWCFIEENQREALSTQMAVTMMDCPNGEEDVLPENT